MSIQQVIRSRDGRAIKFVQETLDKNCRVETTYVDHFSKHIICFSTQVGCRCGCKFCANGLASHFTRNLSCGDIIAQILNIINYEDIIDAPEKPILFSAMGCGEPLMNAHAVKKTFSILHDVYPNAKFALATTGVPFDNLLLLWRLDEMGLTFKPTISLHSAIPEIRKMLLPTSGDLSELMNAMRHYQSNRTPGNYVEYNVVLFDGINDSKEDAEAIFKAFESRKMVHSSIVKINVYNQVAGCGFSPSQHVDEFIYRLKVLGCTVETYATNGSDIGAACGQLVAY